MQEIKYKGKKFKIFETYSTLREYKENYSRLLTEFLTEYQDWDTLAFLSIQRKVYAPLALYGGDWFTERYKLILSFIDEKILKIDNAVIKNVGFIHTETFNNLELKKINERLNLLETQQATAPEPQQATTPEPQQTKGNTDLLEDEAEKATVIKKVLYLKESGIIKFLEDQNDYFKTSQNNLADFLAIITGEKKRTIQKHINELYSKDNSKNKVSEKTMREVKAKLQFLGFKSEKNNFDF